MNKLHYTTNTLAYLAWDQLYVPVRVLPNGDFTFFVYQAQIQQFETLAVCLGYLRGIARVDAQIALCAAF